jgi:PadR family transcriptional regulator, regulatory protein PadR
VPTPVFLGEFEQLVLLALLRVTRRIESDAPVQDLLARLNELAGRSVSRGALYRTLDRLEDKGWVRWRLGDDDVPERRGNPRRHFSVTADGVEVLRASRSTLLGLWAGLELDDA